MTSIRIKLFNLIGLPIYIDLSWFIVVALITWSLAVNVFPPFYPGLAVSTYWWMGLAGALGLFASILAHELGHSVAARYFEMPMRGITLFIFGGVAEMSREPPSAKAEFFVAIAGPVVSVLVAVLCTAAGILGAPVLPLPVAGVLFYLGVINGVLVVFNMIPAFPLDGGRVLRSALWQLRGNLKWATRITSAIGAGFGILLVVFGVMNFFGGNFIGGMWQVLIGLFLRSAARMSYQQVLMRDALEGEPVERFMRTDVVTVPPSATVHELVDDYVYRYHHKMYPVTENGNLLGCVTTRQLRQVPREEWDERAVADIMERCGEENCIQRDTDATDALTAMNRGGASRLIVVDGNHLEGILSLKDLLRFIALKLELEDGGRHLQLQDSR